MKPSCIRGNCKQMANALKGKFAKPKDRSKGMCQSCFNEAMKSKKKSCHNH